NATPASTGKIIKVLRRNRGIRMGVLGHSGSGGSGGMSNQGLRLRWFSDQSGESALRREFLGRLSRLRRPPQPQPSSSGFGIAGYAWAGSVTRAWAGRAQRVAKGSGRHGRTYERGPYANRAGLGKPL